MHSFILTTVLILSLIAFIMGFDIQIWSKIGGIIAAVILSINIIDG